MNSPVNVFLTLQRVLCLQHTFGGQEVPFDVVEYIPSIDNRQDEHGHPRGDHEADHEPF